MDRRGLEYFMQKIEFYLLPYNIIFQQLSKIPKVFESDGWGGYLLGRFIIITDFDLLKDAFSKKALSSKLEPESWIAYRKRSIKGKHIGYDLINLDIYRIKFESIRYKPFLQ